MSNVPSPENTQLDNYLTVEAPLRAPEFKVKGSRFITDIIPVTSKEEIEHALTTIRKEFYDASHHCFAYRLGPGGLMLRAADDGEPTGTAGKPILLVLTSAKLTNTLIVVTRYFKAGQSSERVGLPELMRKPLNRRSVSQPSKRYT